MISFPAKDAFLTLLGPAGKLEILTTPFQDPSRGVAVICHPHPLHGGTLNNKVVTTLARTFKELGLATVRFNFRGVGKSEGQYAEGIGETEDLLAIIAWLRQICPEAPLWLAGFSFGSYVAARAATQVSVAQLVSVAPPVSRFNLAALPPITCPWIIVQGDEDEVVDPNEVFAWIDTLKPKPLLIRIPEASHFFHGKLLELRSELQAILRGLSS